MKQPTKGSHSTESDAEIRKTSEVGDNTSNKEPDRKIQKTADNTEEKKDHQDLVTEEKNKCSTTCDKKAPISDIFVNAKDLKASPGDLIEFNRALYSHWALYVGEDKVIHVSAPSDDISVKEAEVRNDLLVEVAGESLVRVNNKLDKAEERKLTVRDTAEVIQQARSLLGQMVEYNLMNRNCEHYVTEWRYGHGWSDQVSKGMSLFNSMFAPAAPSGGDDGKQDPAQMAMQLFSMYTNSKNRKQDLE